MRVFQCFAKLVVSIIFRSVIQFKANVKGGTWETATCNFARKVES